MINRLHYFYQKLNLAIFLARFDLLFLLKGLSSFQIVIKPASLFVKPSSLPIPRRIQNFLVSRKGFVPDILVSELSVLAMSKGAPLFSLSGEEKSFAPGQIMIRENFELTEQSFYRQLFAEVIAKDFPSFSEANTILKTRLDLAEDMRLFAADLDEVLSLSADSPLALPLTVDWLKTSSEKLYLESSDGFRLTTKLTALQQKKLVSLFAHQLFEKSFFVADWETVAVDSTNKVAIIEFDKMYQINLNDMLAVFKDNQIVMTLTQWKLKRAIMLLEQFCPEVKVMQIFKPFHDSLQQKTPFIKLENHFMNQVSEFGYGFTLPLPKTQPKSLIFRLLSLKPQETGSWFNKSGLLYWGPLFITAIVFFIIFRFYKVHSGG